MRDEIDLSSLPVEGRFIRAVIKDLEELASAQMEHKLGVDAEVVRQSEARRIFLPVVRELLAQANQHAVEPAKHVWRIVALSLEHGDPRHEHCRCFLIEGGGDAG